MVRGAKINISGAFASHELVVLPQAAHFEGEEDYAIAFAVPTDAKGMMVSAIRDPNPVVYLYPAGLRTMVEDVSDEQYETPLDKAAIRTTGSDITIVGSGASMPEVLKATRLNLRNGATQIKIMGGGGVMSDYDPIHSLQPSPAEIRAAVQAASDWGSYVLAHAYTSEAVRRLVENGVRCIEHGLLIDDATAKLVESCGADVAGFGFVVELTFLAGRGKLEGYEVETLVRY